ncbi:MAG: RluA family pseudouridine synthase [Deltaproteobacteria bacterium]|nr:RluA family pseudouridine synthase [Deltaproteobacteria bacterium]
MIKSGVPNKFSIRTIVPDNSSPAASDLLASRSGLSRSRIKDAMNKGAVWLKRKGLGRMRLRKASFVLKKGDEIELHYDPGVLSVNPPDAACLKDYGQYSIWFKPSGLLTQGTDFGDYGTILRQAELYFKSRRKVFPVHRLDREAAGLILIAHSRKATAALSRLFAEHRVVKRYQAEVLGLPEKDEGIITDPIDGKAAVSRYRVIARNPEENTSTLLIEIETGRMHQIRRHLAGAGHPVMGDPRYGAGNKDGRPMRLTACELRWRCPVTGEEREISL